MGRWIAPRVVVDAYPSDLDILQELSPRARAILYLSAVDGYRYSEIADMLGCNETAARMGGMRARNRLLGLLAKEVADG